MEPFVNRLRRDFPHYKFAPDKKLCWSPQTSTIFYPTVAHGSPATVRWGVLHELGHAELAHNHYVTDTHLLRQEVAAWTQAGKIAEQYAITIDSDYVENCLDSYRDWLHKRSICPTCGMHGLQTSRTLYRCINCRLTWKVSENRFCRTYRKQQLSAKLKTDSL